MNNPARPPVQYAVLSTTSAKTGASVSVQPLRKNFKTDDRLVRLARTGRRQAFDELVSRYHRRATSVAYRLVGNLHDALEVCQDAYVRAYRSLHRLEDPNRFGAWLMRIVTNLGLNYRRRRGVRRGNEDCLTNHEGALEDECAGAPPALQFPGAYLAAEELAVHLRRELAALPEAQRSALILFSIEALPQKQVAKILGCSVEAVKWHVFQARRKIRLRLADYL
jgi:RNA polymerase sigma-70 factor (ECF subfamily)